MGIRTNPKRGPFPVNKPLRRKHKKVNSRRSKTFESGLMRELLRKFMRVINYLRVLVTIPNQKESTP